MIERHTEWDGEELARINDFMQRRIRYFGAPCLTVQEYRAVVLSLYGLPEVSLKHGAVTVELELPTQRYVAGKMKVSESRVSQLLASAARALLWFEAHDVPEVGWHRLPRGHGIAKWDFRAPVLEHPIPPDPERRSTRVHAIRCGDAYRLAFAGEAAIWSKVLVVAGSKVARKA